jgi:hypothetical protein
VQSTPVTITTTNVSTAEAAQVEVASQAIVTAVENTVIPSSASGGSASTTTTTNTTTTTTNQQPVNPTVVSPSG